MAPSTTKPTPSWRPATTDRRGVLHVPHHDGSLLGVVCRSDTEVEITYRSMDEVLRAIWLRDVRSMDVHGFRNGNIICSIQLVPSSEAPRVASSEQLARLGHGEPPAALAPWLFLLDSSYGAEIVADCEAAYVAELGP